MTKGKSCFIITPIGHPKSEIFRKITGVIESVIRPVLLEKGYTDVKAAHEICEVGSINNQVINKIIESDLVIANLTGNNPNVMYELCLRHVVAKPIIHICENGTDLPFDIKDSRTIFYDDDMLGVAELRKELCNFVGEINFNKEYKDNPVYNAKKIGALLKAAQEESAKDINLRLLNVILDKVSRIEEDSIRDRNGTEYIHQYMRYENDKKNVQEIEEKLQFIENQIVKWEENTQKNRKERYRSDYGGA